MKRERYSDEKIIKAINLNGGIINGAAKSLKLDRGTLSDWIKASKTLTAALEAARDILIDECESALFTNVKAGKEISVIFALKTIGRKRGYIEQLQITNKDNINDHIENASDEELKEIMAKTNERFNSAL